MACLPFQKLVKILQRPSGLKLYIVASNSNFKFLSRFQEYNKINSYPSVTSFTEMCLLWIQMHTQLVAQPCVSACLLWAHNPCECVSSVVHVYTTNIQLQTLLASSGVSYSEVQEGLKLGRESCPLHSLQVCAKYQVHSLDSVKASFWGLFRVT